MRYSTNFMERHRVVLVDEDESVCTVASSHTASTTLTRLLQSYHAKRVQFQIVRDEELTLLMQRATRVSGTVVESHGTNRRQVAEARRINDAAAGTTLLNLILNEAVLQRASDIHLEAARGTTSLRYRVDGIVGAREKIHLTPSEAALVVARAKVLAGANAAERRHPTDGSFSATTVTGPIDVRLSTVPTMDGESLVLRLFHKREREFELHELGMSDDHFAIVDDAIHETSGLIAVCGPTGCGKTTSVYAMIRRLYGSGRKIVTIEDPVEYRLPEVQQIQTNERIGLTFGSLLRNTLRQDPDVILVGEIRDEETARLAVRATHTGHLVMATLHAPSADGAMRRLADLGVSDRPLSGVKALFVSQRLVRMRCHCTVQRSECPDCRGSGWAGRTGRFTIHSEGGRR